MMLETSSHTPLYHVGCGTYLFDLEQANGMLLACRCGANSPLMVLDLESKVAETPVIPASLGRLMAYPERWAKDADTVPHLEVYLGFSDFECPAKRAWELQLKNLGCVSGSECHLERCRQEEILRKESQR